MYDWSQRDQRVHFPLNILVEVEDRCFGPLRGSSLSNSGDLGPDKSASYQSDDYNLYGTEIVERAIAAAKRAVLEIQQAEAHQSVVSAVRLSSPASTASTEDGSSLCTKTSEIKRERKSPSATVTVTFNKAEKFLGSIPETSYPTPPISERGSSAVLDIIDRRLDLRKCADNKDPPVACGPPSPIPNGVIGRDQRLISTLNVRSPRVIEETRQREEPQPAPTLETETVVRSRGLLPHSLKKRRIDELSHEVKEGESIISAFRLGGQTLCSYGAQKRKLSPNGSGRDALEVHPI